MTHILNFTIAGVFSAPQSSLTTEAMLHIIGDDVKLTVEGGQTVWQGTLKDLRIDPPLGTLSRKIYLPNSYLFETSQNDLVDQIKANGFWKRLVKIEKTGWHLILFAIITPILAFGLYSLVIPLFISFAIFMTPEAAIRLIDKNTIKSMDLAFMDPSELSPERQEDIQELFSVLVTQAESETMRKRRMPNYNLLFRTSEHMGPNAFALPGGTIVLTDELVNMFPEEDYVLNAVIGHEIGHVVEEHSLKQIYRALGMAALVSLVAGDAGPMLEDIVLEGSALLSLSFSRKHEMQSDDYSYELLKSSGLRTDGLVTFFNRINEEFPIPEAGEWMMTHPLSRKRVENIESKLEADGISYEPVSADLIEEDLNKE